MHDHFKDSTHTEYNAAVRRLVETEGFAAFGRENDGLYVIHYGAQNMRQKQFKPTTLSIKRPSVCQRWKKAML